MAAIDLAAPAALWWDWVTGSFLGTAALAAVAAAVDGLLGRRLTAGARAVLWVAVLARLAVPPGVVSPVGLAVAAEPGVATPAVPTVLFCMWSALTAAFAVTGILRLRAVGRRLRARQGSPPADLVATVARAAARLGLGRPPALRMLPGPGSPFVFGLLRPVIFVPAELLASLSPTEQEHVLLHEVAHVARRDPWRATAALLVQILCWFHPAAWLACRRLRILREMAADHRVQRCLGNDRDGYRSTLGECARHVLLPRSPGIAMLGMEREILARLAELRRPRTAGPRLQVAAATAVAALLLACSVPCGVQPFPPEVAVSDLPGCMQKRFLVLAAMARADAAESR